MNRTKNGTSEAKQLQDRTKDDAKTGYSMIVTQMTDLFERVQNYIGLEEHCKMIENNMEDLDEQINELSDYLKNLEK